MNITDVTAVDNTVDSWGYQSRFVDELTRRGSAVCKPGDSWGRRSTSESGSDLPRWPVVHNPQDRRRQQDLFARMTGDL